jgi:uncharacterized SAM-binding protein YcdF (DUF218 family)
MTAIKHILELMLNPFFLLCLLLLICILLLGNRTSRARDWGRGILVAIGCLLLLFSTGWIPLYITKHLEASYPVIQQVDPKVRWVVVLGGGHYENLSVDMPANDLLTGASIKRLIEGVRLLRQLPDARLVLSGGGELESLSEAVLLQQVSQWFSIPAKNIVLESNSLNTADQARSLVSMVHHEPFYLVTSAIHMPRSMLLCQQQGLHPIAAPTDFTFFWNDSNQAKIIVPNAYNFYYFTVAMHELLGRGWIYLNQAKFPRSGLTQHSEVEAKN